MIMSNENDQIILSDMKSMENVGITPCEMFSRMLFASVLLNLFINLTTV